MNVTHYSLIIHITCKFGHCSTCIVSKRKKSVNWTITLIKSRRMRWAGHVARMGEERGVYRVLGGGNRRKRDHWGDLGVDGWIILGWISRRWDVGIWTGLGWPRIEIGGGRL